MTIRLIVSYCNWIWPHGRTGDTAAQRAGIASLRWFWEGLIFLSHVCVNHDP